MKYTLEFVFIERWREAALSTYKRAAQTHSVRCLFCQLRKWPPAHMLGRVYRPVRPLVLIHNSMVKSELVFALQYLGDRCQICCMNHFCCSYFLNKLITNLMMNFHLTFWRHEVWCSQTAQIQPGLVYWIRKPYSPFFWSSFPMTDVSAAHFPGSSHPVDLGVPELKNKYFTWFFP